MTKFAYYVSSLSQIFLSIVTKNTVTHTVGYTQVHYLPILLLMKNDELVVFFFPEIRSWKEGNFKKAAKLPRTFIKERCWCCLRESQPHSNHKETIVE